jgi:hypothetical protein
MLQWLPTREASSSSSHAIPFKVQVNFDIPLFEGLIDAYVVDKWLNLLEGYFSVHNFFDREKITFALLKVVPHVKDWWNTYSEQTAVEESTMFVVAPTWDSFWDAIKEQYYPVGSYEDRYTGWTTLRQERDQTVPDFTNIFHTLRTKLGIKDSECHLVLKYHGCLHRYIHIEMEFLDIASLGATYRYAIKIEHKFKQKQQEFRSANPSQPKQGKGCPNPHNKGPSRDGHPQDNQSKPQHKKGNEKTKKDTEKWCEYHKSPWYNTEECRSKQSLLVKLKASDSEVDSNSESNSEGGKQIIDVEPSATVATTKVRPSKLEEPEEGECLFHSQMWVKGALIHFFVDDGCQKNLISAEVVKQLDLPTTPHLQPYTIG